MKPSCFPLFLAMAVVPAVSHAAPPVFNQGDLIMGFRATGGSGAGTCYSVNIGPAATYRDATSNVVRNIAEIGNIDADLDGNFGGSWYSRTDVLWGIAGCPSNNAAVGADPEDTLYYTRSITTTQFIASPTTRGTVATKMIQSVTGPGSFTDSVTYAATANSAWAILQPESNANSWRYFMNGGAGTTGSFDFGSLQNIEANPNQTLHLFRMDSTAGPLEGSFSLSSSGVLTFTPNVLLSYDTWKSAPGGAGGQAQGLDFDGDGIQNGVEFFMGTPGDAFTANPQISPAGTVTWPRASGRSVSSFGVQVSTDLVNWSPAPSGVNTSNASQVVYTVPTGLAKHFFRFTVTP